MNYEHLFAFVTFADHRNFTRAAAQLHISQPALHVQIRKLGEAIGRPLYVKVGRELVLTVEGERLAAYGREVRDRGDRVLAELRGERTAGPTILAAGQGALRYLLGPAIRRFRHPLRVLALPAPATIDAVRSARAHLGIVAGDVPDDLDAARLRLVGQHVVVPASHRLAGRRSVDASALAAESIIVAPSGTPHRALVEHALRAVEWRIAVEVTGWEVMLHLARLELGIAIVNDFCEAGRGLTAIPLRDVPAVTYHVISRDVVHPAAAQLRDRILGSFTRS